MYLNPEIRSTASAQASHPSHETHLRQSGILDSGHQSIIEVWVVRVVVRIDIIVVIVVPGSTMRRQLSVRSAVGRRGRRTRILVVRSGASDNRLSHATYPVIFGRFGVCVQEVGRLRRRYFKGVAFLGLQIR